MAKIKSSKRRTTYASQSKEKTSAAPISGDRPLNVNHSSHVSGAETKQITNSIVLSSSRTSSPAKGKMKSISAVRAGRANVAKPSTAHPRGQSPSSAKPGIEQPIDRLPKRRANVDPTTTESKRGELLSDVQSCTDNYLSHDIGGADRVFDDDHSGFVSAETSSGVQTACDIHTTTDPGGPNHRGHETHAPAVRPELIDQIIELWRCRQNWHRAEKSLTLQAKGYCRRIMAGDKDAADGLYKSALNGGDHQFAAVAQMAIMPLVMARDGIEKHHSMIEKQLSKLAADLPAAAWVKATRGIGLGGFASIVGEAGDLAKYANPAKLWKRMGLAVMPDGGRQRIVAGDAAIEHGYNPARRSVIWTIGDSIIKTGGDYRAIYDARKVYENDKNERGEYAERAARALKAHNYGKTTIAYKHYSEGKLPPAHIHASAKRFMEKRLLRDLWRAWRDAIYHPTSIANAHLAESVQVDGQIRGDDHISPAIN